MKMYMVGGAVRDEILGAKSKDIDFSVVLDDGDLFKMDKAFIIGRPSPYEYMVLELESMGVKVFRDDDSIPIGAEFLTARGRAPHNFPTHGGRALDFVLARKESGYTDGRRPDVVEPGTLMDDLSRRDFTMNAIAKDTDGSLIDPFHGQIDIERKIIKAVGDPFERLAEDALRAVRALRFSVTKGFAIDFDLRAAMEADVVLNDIAGTRISDERIKDELSKMFRFDTVASLYALSACPLLTRAMFFGSVSLDSTMKTKGRSK